MIQFKPSAILICALLMAAFYWQCSNGNTAKADDKVLAQAYNKTLYQSDLLDVIPQGVSHEDSVLIQKAFVQRWIREQLLMYEAERNIPKDLNIDQLVRDYRASLVRFNFEEQIIAQKLDSTVSEATLQAFYEQNKDQFQLESTILKCLLIKIPTQAPQSELNKLWYARDADAQLIAFARQWNAYALLDREKWYKLEEVAAFLPKGTLTSENIRSRSEGTLSDAGFRYYYRVLETVQGKTTAPLDYIREQAIKVILHQRKQELLEKWKEDLYQKELRRENVKIMQ
ncbi:MAG: hypothetical protein KGS48_12330 [Bacteroidetes bacterium]|nr:hypothetical protein [Bacteroidota bacterium]